MFLVWIQPLHANVLGILLVVIGGTSRLGALLLQLQSSGVMLRKEKWIQPHLAGKSFFSSERWSCQVTQPIIRTLLWSGSWFPAVDVSRGSKSVEVQRVWGVLCRTVAFHGDA